MNSTADGHIDQVHGVTVHAAQDSAANAQIEAEIESQNYDVLSFMNFFTQICAEVIEQPSCPKRLQIKQIENFLDPNLFAYLLQRERYQQLCIEPQESLYEVSTWILDLKFNLMAEGEDSVITYFCFI